MNLKLATLEPHDAFFISTLRNSVRYLLHDNTEYDEEEVREWIESEPWWYIVLKNNWLNYSKTLNT